MLLERFGFFGGNITAVGVEGFAWYRREATVEAGGLAHEFEQRAHAMGAATPESQSCSYELDSEGFKVVADRLVLEAGVRPMLHRSFVAPVLDGDRLTGVIVESKAGREAITAQVVIDATGDADVAYRAGAPTRTTPREEMLAASVMFHLAGVDPRGFLEGVRADPQTYGDWRGEWSVETTGKEDALYSPFLRKPFTRAAAEGTLPADVQTLGGTWGALHETGELTYCNLVHLDACDGTDPDDLTAFEIEGRRQALLAVEALRRYTPGCGQARLRNFGATIGVRDTRKIRSRRDLTADEVSGEGRVDDSIGIFPEFIDGYGLLVLPTTGRYFQVPYGCVVPWGVRGLLVAGRATGGDAREPRRDPEHGVLRRHRAGGRGRRCSGCPYRHRGRRRRCHGRAARAGGPGRAAALTTEGLPRCPSPGSGRWSTCVPCSPRSVATSSRSSRICSPLSGRRRLPARAGPSTTSPSTWSTTTCAACPASATGTRAV